MKNVARLAVIAAVASIATASAMYGPSVAGDPAQKAGGRSRPPAAAQGGHAVPRSGTADGQHAAPPPHAVPRSVPPQRIPPPIVVHPRIYVPPWGWHSWPYPYGYPPPYPYWIPTAYTGDVQLDVLPTDAEVYVDGYFAGFVSDFNGIFHRLTLPPGQHLIEMRKIGMATLAVEMYVAPGQTLTYRAMLQPGYSSGDDDETGAAPVAPPVD